MPLYDVTISRAKWQWATVRIEAEDEYNARGMAAVLPEHGMAWVTEDNWEYGRDVVEEVTE